VKLAPVPLIDKPVTKFVVEAHVTVVLPAVMLQPVRVMESRPLPVTFIPTTHPSMEELAVIVVPPALKLAVMLILEGAVT
jgi:hypothetical protein